MYAFGVAPTGVPNQNDATPAIANTEVISLNNSVLGQLAPGDVRANYYFVGSTWTFGGFAPTVPYPLLPTGANNQGSELGTSFLTNSTMETYDQATSTSASTNCFSCHNIGGGTPPAGTAVTTKVSHIYSSLLPLFNTTSTTAKPAKKK
jgi:mono/diheme cytochrome c family protein